MPGHTDKKDDKKKNGGGMSWISFVKAYAKKNNMKYNEALKKAGPEFRKMKKYFFFVLLSFSFYILSI